MFVEGVLWIVRTGSPWRDLPDVFGEWNGTTFARRSLDRCSKRRITASHAFPSLNDSIHFSDADFRHHLATIALGNIPARDLYASFRPAPRSPRNAAPLAVS
jgi:hypothetical protein